MKKIAAAILVAVCLRGPAGAQMCGDCDHDQRVSVDELVRSVHNALVSTGCDECSLDCHGGTTPWCQCPLSCGELFTVGDTQFQGSFCDDGGQSKREACVALRCETDPSLCFTVVPEIRQELEHPMLGLDRVQP
jgi:hypothetical protein